MFKSSALQSFFLGLLLFCASSCSLWRANESSGSGANTRRETAAETRGEIPFSTKEPEIYQAEIVNRIYLAGGETERKIFSARNRASRLTVFNPGEPNEMALLESGSSGAVFSIHHGKKIYAEYSSPETSPGSAPPAETTARDFLTGEWLNQKTPAAFENLGTENNLTKYRVRLGEAEKAASETFIFVDENLKLPVRQEVYSLDGEQQQRALLYSVEFKNFKAEAGDRLFALPKDYRQISRKEFREILWKERTKNE